jgi:1-acyl-sn-glycerol-3-phosphate acyltransferase
MFRPFNPNNVKHVSNLIWHGIKILGIEMEVRNEHFFNAAPFVVVSNHQENMDVFAGARAIPARTVSLGKKSIIFIPFFGLFYWLSGNILIDRKNKKSAFGTMDFAAKQIIEKNVSIWILAEGTRSKGRGLLPFKKGAFITAIKAQVPIIPVAISNYKGNIHFNKWNAGKIIIEVLPQISTLNLTMQDADELKNLAHSQIKNKLEELDRELRK